MRTVPESANRADWPRLVAQTVNALVNRETAGGAECACDLGMVYPEEYGGLALENGAGPTVPQTTALKAALESGKTVNLRGRTYVIGPECYPDEETVTGIWNGKLVWAAANQSDQSAMLNLMGQSDVSVVDVDFDLGTTEDTGTNDDSSRCALAVGSGDPDPETWLPGVKVRRVTITGAGNGTGIFARGLAGAVIENPKVKDRIVGGTPTNDVQNGIDLSWGRDNQIINPEVDRLWTRVSGTLTRIYSRGILLTEQEDSKVLGGRVSDCDQGIDLSGGISGALPNGNDGCSIIGVTVRDVRTWGIKLANVARNTLVTSNTVANFGWAGVIISPPAALPSGSEDKATSYNTVIANKIRNPSAYDGRTNCIGIWITPRDDFPGYPVGCIVRNNTVRDDTGGGRLLHGFAQTDGNYDIVVGGPYNNFIGNTVTGQTGTAEKGTQTEFSLLGDYADDTAAASGGVLVGKLYRTGSILKVRVS